MLITQDTKNRTRDLELGGSLESGDGEDYVMGIEELEEQVPSKGGRTRCGRPHEARSLWWKIVKKVPAGPRHIPWANFISQIAKSWKHPP